MKSHSSALKSHRVSLKPHTIAKHKIVKKKKNMHEMTVLSIKPTTLRMHRIN